MEISKLMIGDWVLHDDEYVKVCRVSNLGHCESQVVVLNTKGGCIHPKIEELKPIPLTPEILEKNGFNKVGNIYLISCGDNAGIVISYEKGKYSIDIRKREKKDTDGRVDMVTFCRDWFENFYVHELQHLLRLCGIEKEVMV